MLSSLRKKRYRQEDIRTDYSRVEDIEEFNLPAPIPDLPLPDLPFQPESYKENNYGEYGEEADDGENIKSSPSTISDDNNDSTNIDFSQKS